MKLIDIISEDVELDEGAWKTDDQWLDLLKKTYPKWDYSNAVLDRKKTNNDNILQIKNVFCTIHNHSFPEENRTEWISVKKMLDPKRQTGCHDCRVDKFRDKIAYDDVKWINSLSNIEKFKDKVDFSKSKFSYVEPLKNGPLLTKAYCKIHKKNFLPGDPNKDGQGIRCNEVSQRENICPYCIKNTLFVNKAKSFEDWVEDFNSNELNKNNDYSRCKVYYNDKGVPYVSNINCTVKGLNGKPHGLYAKGEGVSARLHQEGYFPCPKCECEGEQKEFIKKAIEKHNVQGVPTYLYDRVDFCNPIKVNGKMKVLIGCKVPKHPYFLQGPGYHQRGSGCPICRASRGEKHIFNLLLTNFGEKYKVEKETDLGFEVLSGKRFDFYIPELKVVIEYDGIGHFTPSFGTSDFSRDKSFNDTFENDNFKNTMIKSRGYNPTGIRLIRIPYTMKFEDIENELLKAIDKTKPNEITYIGDYPRRKGRKTPESKFKVDLSQPIQKPKRMTESKLSLINIIKDIK